MSDRNQDIQDLGRIINMLIARMGRTPPTKPEGTVELYVSSDLKTFKADAQDILNVRMKSEGVPDFKLIPGGRIKMGGAGIVLQVQNAEADVRYALKFVRPTFFDKAENRDNMFTVAKREFLRHVPLSHNNIARILGAARFEEPRDGMDHTFFAMMMEWIENATPLGEYLSTLCEKPSPSLLSDIVALLSQCFSALAYIHTHNIIHWDLKSDNFLVSNNIVKLADFGNARILTDNSRGKIAFTTQGNFPPGLDEHIVARDDTGSSNRIRIDLPDPDIWDCPWLDMWMLARVLMELLGEPNEPYQVSTTFTPREGAAESRRLAIEKIIEANDDRNEYLLLCLRTILRRILIPTSPSQNRYYKNAEGVVADLAKLEPEFGASQSVGELWAVPQRMLRLPVSGNVPFTSRVRRIFDTHLIDRLSHHLQLGGVYQVYRGASHTRTEHVAGVLAAACDYVRALFADQSNVFWRLNIERRDVDILLFGALVHDIGHIAFGHFVEEMEGLINDRKHENYLLAVLDPSRFDAAWTNSDTIKKDRDILVRAVQVNWGARSNSEAEDFLRDVATILSPAPSTREFVQDDIFDESLCKEIKKHVLHSIIDSAIDADKLDYLFRDAHHCGVPYAFAIDYDRFFQSLTVIPDFSRVRKTAVEPRQPCIGVTAKGIAPLESMLVARYQMFTAVYWQHTARAQTCMLHFVISEFLVCSVSALTPPQNIVNLEINIDTLVHEFRNRSDEGAIAWLRAELKKINIDPGHEQRLDNICRCLLNEESRSFLYREVFKLTYEREQEEELSNIYSVLSDWSRNANKSQNALEYIRKVRSKREEICAKLAKELDMPLSDGDVLIDIPPAGKDQVDDVYVDFGDRVRPIYDVSPLGSAVKDIFAKWTRSVRIFMDADALSRWLGAGKTHRELELACLEVLKTISASGPTKHSSRRVARS